MECIAYKKGYKYQLVETYTTTIPVHTDTDLHSNSGFIDLSAAGELIIHAGYAWDGPSGPTIDTRNFMRGSLVHDALYQLMREGLLDKNLHREPADRLLQQMCIEDGMSSIRAWWVYQGVRFGGDPAADPSNQKQAVRAPAGC